MRARARRRDSRGSPKTRPRSSESERRRPVSLLLHVPTNRRSRRRGEPPEASNSSRAIEDLHRFRARSGDPRASGSSPRHAAAPPYERYRDHGVANRGTCGDETSGGVPRRFCNEQAGIFVLKDRSNLSWSPRMTRRPTPAPHESQGTRSRCARTEALAFICSDRGACSTIPSRRPELTRARLHPDIHVSARACRRCPEGAGRGRGVARPLHDRRPGFDLSRHHGARTGSDGALTRRPAVTSAGAQSYVASRSCRRNLCKSAAGPSCVGPAARQARGTRHGGHAGCVRLRSAPRSSRRSSSSVSRRRPAVMTVGIGAPLSCSAAAILAVSFGPGGREPPILVRAPRLRRPSKISSDRTLPFSSSSHDEIGPRPPFTSCEGARGEGRSSRAGIEISSSGLTVAATVNDLRFG